MDFSIDKYRFYHSNNTVIAVSTFAGKPVRGIAKCDPEDEFSLEDGKLLAAARCHAKIAEKRLKRAKRKFAEAQEEYVLTKRRYDDMFQYFKDAIVQLDDAHNNVLNVISKIAP